MIDHLNKERTALRDFQRDAILAAASSCRYEPGTIGFANAIAEAAMDCLSFYRFRPEFAKALCTAAFHCQVGFVQYDDERNVVTGAAEVALHIVNVIRPIIEVMK